ncbi:hypothetical protein [Kordia antarctica]|uniref:hypothetical protein n=1 Tax=Kordia antarctica TaxID=1218801 RepID=UPI001D148BA0|nr:hypothetical protein [Kordia antarctica]
MNLENKYATIHLWSGDPIKNQRWIHEAFEKRGKLNPNNSMELMTSNWKGKSWEHINHTPF